MWTLFKHIFQHIPSMVLLAGKAHSSSEKNKMIPHVHQARGEIGDHCQVIHKTLPYASQQQECSSF